MPLLLQYIWHRIVSHRRFQRKSRNTNSIQLQPPGRPNSTPHQRAAQADSGPPTPFYNRNSFWMTITSILAVLGGLAFFLAQKPYWDWTAQKDFLEYCQSLSNANKNVTKSCDKALTNPLPPPPFSRIHVARRVLLPVPKHGWAYEQPLDYPEYTIHSGHDDELKPLSFLAILSLLLALVILAFRRARVVLLAWKSKRNLQLVRLSPDITSDEERRLESLGQSTRNQSNPTSHTTTLETPQYVRFRRRVGITNTSTVFIEAMQVLGPFNLAVAAAVEYKGGFKQLHKFKNLHSALSNVIETLDEENQNFWETIKFGLTKLGISRDEIPVFRSSIIQSALPSSSLIKSVKHEIDDLQSIFSAKHGQVYWTDKGEAILHRKWKQKCEGVINRAAREIAVLRSLNLEFRKVAESINEVEAE